MSRAIMLSIRPEWCSLIAQGKKTIEVRKNRPKLETPFKCYIYCTGKGTLDPHKYLEVHSDDGHIHNVNGKVMGEFVCADIETIDVPYPAYQNKLDKRILEQSCLKYYDLHRYAYHDNVYGWHISELKIYDKPKELSEFTNEHAMLLKRPPQSWCYVEELEV